MKLDLDIICLGVCLTKDPYSEYVKKTLSKIRIHTTQLKNRQNIKYTSQQRWYVDGKQAYKKITNSLHIIGMCIKNSCDAFYTHLGYLIL
jgi:hypothetical protein